MSIQFLVIMVPVLLGTMGFAVDLGRLWLVRGELNQAAAAMALAAAERLNGTTAATEVATAAANATLDSSLADSNKYNFGSIVVGQSSGSLTSEVAPPAFFGTLVDALSAFGQTAPASTADGASARHVAVSLTAEAPLLFWGLLTVGQSRKTTVAASAIAGMSAPLCVACGIEPFTVAAVSTDDAVDFGFIAGNLYTMRYQCNGAAGANGAIAGTSGIVPYALIDRYDSATSTFAEDQQLYRVGAQGLGPSTTSSIACASVGATETVWGTAAGAPIPVRACNVAAPNLSVESAMCGVSTRLSDDAPAVCSANTNLSTLAPAYLQDTDITQITDYTTYAGNNRRLMTLPVVDSLATLTVVGFRQFLLQPNDAAGTINNPADGAGRFVVQYVGSVAPIRQGRMDPAPQTSCSITSGPGKAILHQ